MARLHWKAIAAAISPAGHLAMRPRRALLSAAAALCLAGLRIACAQLDVAAGLAVVVAHPLARKLWHTG